VSTTSSTPTAIVSGRLPVTGSTSELAIGALLLFAAGAVVTLYAKARRT